MNWYDLALCIDNIDNQMTFVGHIVSLCRAQMMLLEPSKSHVIVLSTKLCRRPGKYNTFRGKNLFLKNKFTWERVAPLDELLFM